VRVKIPPVTLPEVDAHSRGEPWALANEYPASSLPGEADALFATLVAQKTHGALAIVAMPDAKLGYTSREQLRAVASGALAMADSFAGALGDAHPVLTLSTLPFVVDDIASARALYDAARAAYGAAFAAQHQRLVFATPWPASGLWSRAPIHSPQDLAKTRIRSYDETGAALFARLGAVASAVSFADLAPRLERGEIDAVLSSGDGGAGAKLRDRLPFFTEINYAIPLSFTTVNLDKWRALDDATRLALQDAGAETESRQWRAWSDRRAQNYARMRAHGVSIATAISPPLRTRLRESASLAASAWAAAAGREATALLAPFLD
jgi:TRAP-type C4-dicarboxylate transport system substrate-binding protein